jgi:hypothetical protein
MIHAGEKMVYVKNGLLMWKASSGSGNCHSQMNFKNYEKWLLERLILQSNSVDVVVIDNTPYHSVLSE